MTDAARSPRVVRTLARVATALFAIECAACLYVLTIGEIHFEIGPLRVSVGTWRHPFTQAIVLGLVATALYWRDPPARGKWQVVPRLARRIGTGAIANIRAEPLLWSGMAVAVAVAVIVCDRVAVRAFIIGSEAGGWTYPYVRGVPVQRIAVVVLACGLGFALLFWRETRPGGAAEWGRIAAWILVATGLQAVLRSLSPFGFDAIFLSEGANSFYTVTQHYDAATVLGQFTEQRVHWPLHANSNMPGKLMLLYLLQLVSHDPTVLAWLMVAISNLGGVLLYLLVRDLFGDRRVALYSLVLYLFVPAKLFFFPLMNTVTPVVAFGCALLLHRWLQTSRLPYAVAAGAALYVLMFFEPVPLVIGALVAFVAVDAIRRGRLTWTQLAVQSLVVVAVFTAMLALVWIGTGFNLAVAFHRVAADASVFNAHENRPYGLWVWRNPIEFFFGAGICQAVLFWFATADGLRSHTDSRAPIDRPIVQFVAALAVMLLALDLAGINRGEAIRLWIFLACLFQVPAAWVCARLQSRAALATVLMLTVLQSALATAMIGFAVP